jgi:tetratricopeptide (TPR) repeat protein
MRRLAMVALTLALAAAAPAADLEHELSAANPDDAAILNYLALAKQGKASAQDLAELGVLLIDRGDTADAEHYLRAAVKIDPHSFPVLYRLGLVLQREGEAHAAARWFRRALRVHPDDPYARFMLALSEERSGNRRAAVRDYVTAYRRMPDLAIPQKNPLVYDSDLQTQAQIERYREESTTTTFPITAIDEAAVEQMMKARPAAAPEPTAALPGAAGEQAPPGPTPVPEEIPVPAPTATPAPMHRIGSPPLQPVPTPLS